LNIEKLSNKFVCLSVTSLCSIKVAKFMITHPYLNAVGRFGIERHPYTKSRIEILLHHLQLDAH